MKSVMIGAGKYADESVSWIALFRTFGFAFVHSQLPTGVQTPSAETLARSNIIRLPSID